MIFYFSATGNTLHVARNLDPDAISIPQVMRDADLHFKADKIGIAAPIYGHEIPQMVKDFIRKAEFNTDYLYVILTYGARHANAVELARKVFQEKGCDVDYIATVLMVDNFLPAFDMEQQVKLNKHVEEQIAAIRQDIEGEKNEIEAVSEEDCQHHASYLGNVGGRPETVWADFDFTDDCIGCGICTKVCPAGCIHLENGRAVRTGENCQACFACVHACPKMAIKMNPVMGYEEPNPQARYRNENVTLQDIIKANDQSRH